MIVRELVTKLGFKTDPKQIEGFESKVKSAKVAVLALTAAVTAATTAIFLLVNSAAKTGDELDKVKDVLGLTIKQIQLLGGAAALSGVEHEGFITAMQFFAKAVGMARMGMMEQLRAFQLLGISLRGANGQLKSQHELLMEVANGFTKVKNTQDKAALAQILFSRSGGRMINMFKDGSKGLKDLMATVAKYGFIMDEKGVKQSAEFTDKMFLAKFAIKSLKDQIGLALMPTFKKLLDQFLKWINANKKMLTLKIEEFFIAMLKVTKAVGKVFVFLITTISNFIAIIKTFNQEFGIALKLLEVFIALRIVSKMKMIISAFSMLKAGVALLFSPIGLLVAGFLAFLLVLDDINAYIHGRDSLIGRFIKEFPRVAKAIGQAVKPIKAYITYFIIDPLEFIIFLIKKIRSEFYKLSPIIGGYGKKSPLALAQMATMAPRGTITGMLEEYKPLAWGRGISATAGSNVNINTNVNLAVPAGTPTDQQSFLISSAHDAFHSGFTKEIKKALTVFPEVEK